MKTGTKSLLFGCHQFLIHPLFVLWAWVKLYGWPNWKELLCIVIHDWGYWGCPNMDDEEGEKHPEWAAIKAYNYLGGCTIEKFGFKLRRYHPEARKYKKLCLYHSRFYARKHRELPSKLCWADKLGTAIMPAWLWVWTGRLSGELQEYMSNPKYETYRSGATCPYKWFRDYSAFIHKMFAEQGISL